MKGRSNSSRVFLVVVIVSLVLIFALYLYWQTYRFMPNCKNVPYVYITSTNNAVLTDQEARNLLRDYVYNNHENLNVSLVEPLLSQIHSRRDVLVKGVDGLESKKEVWVNGAFSVAIDTEGNIYRVPVCA